MQNQVEQACKDIQEFFDQFVQQISDGLSAIKVALTHADNVIKDMKDNESDLLDLEMAISKYMLLTSAPKPIKSATDTAKTKELEQTIKEKDQQIDLLN